MPQAWDIIKGNVSVFNVKSAGGPLTDLEMFWFIVSFAKDQDIYVQNLVASTRKLVWIIIFFF